MPVSTWPSDPSRSRRRGGGHRNTQSTQLIHPWLLMCDGTQHGGHVRTANVDSTADRQEAQSSVLSANTSGSQISVCTALRRTPRLDGCGGAYRTRRAVH
eukprot:4192676-Prymnesium_polylepis.1